jgi:hybrid cluster-associated redox disulfide protein
LKKITLQTTIEAVLQNYPEAIEFFESKGMYCSTCKGKKHETVQYSAIYYGYDPEEFLKQLKDFIKRQKSQLKKVK